MSWRLVVRSEGKVQRSAHASGAAALDALETACRALTRTARRDTITVAKRTYEPIVQVAGRAELRGPGGKRAGVDVRGDGSAEAFTGRWSKQLVQQRKKESAYDALRRELLSED